MAPVATGTNDSVSLGATETTNMKLTPEATKKTLPSRWWRDDKVFQLEKRAIFSKLWLLASHTSRFEKPGDYISGNYVYDYIIIKGKSGDYQAFHNVCRHRAFPVVTKPTGSTLVLGCKYHGWSYNTNGDLIKAPKFDEVPGFDKSTNGLFKVHTHVTPQGFIFLNFDSSPIPVPFEEHFADLPAEWKHFKPEEYQYCYSWHAIGRFNWKTLMDGYQECYHCSIGHPGFAKTLDLDKYRVTPLTNAARHQCPTSNSQPVEETAPSFTFVFPTTGVTVTDPMWYTMRTVPISANETRLEYDVFKRQDMSYDEAREYMTFYEQVEQEDFDLCEATQRGLNAGVYSKGFLHPVRENGVLYYQGRVLEFCKAHFEAETRAGQEINPAQPASQQHGDSCAATSICFQLESNSALSW